MNSKKRTEREKENNCNIPEDNTLKTTYTKKKKKKIQILSKNQDGL